MKAKVHHGMFLVQERQAKIRSKAPRYSFNFNPKIFDDECEALQQEYEQDTEESQPAALKIYKNIQAEVLETAEQLKNIKKAALKVAGIEEKQEDGIDKLISPQDNDDSSNSGIVSNSTMLSDMMKRKADLSATPSVQDTWGHQVEEGTTAWIRGQNQQLPGMQNQSSNQASTSWQQTPVPKVGPPTQVFIPQTPAARLFPESQWSIGRPSPESFVPPQPRQPLAGPPRETFAPRFPGSMPETSTRPMQQAPMAWPPVGQNLVPRGFQQQMGSMPLPPGPPASVIRPPMQMMPSADGSGPPRRVPMSQPMQSSQGFAPFPQAMGCPEAGIFPQALGMSDGGQPSSIQGIGANWPAGFPTQGMMLASRQSALPSSPGQMPGNLPPGMMARNPQTFSPQRMPGNLRPGMMAPNPQTLSPQRMPGNLPPGTIAPTPQTFPPQQVNPGIRPTMPMRPQVQTAPMQQTFARPFTGAQPPTALPQQNFARPPFVNTQCRPA